MAKIDCVAEVEKIVGRKLSDDEAIEIFGAADRGYKRRREDHPGESPREAWQAVGQELADRARARAIIERRNALINAQTRLINEDTVWSNYRENLTLGLESTLTGVNASLKGSQRSAAAEQHQLAGNYMGGFIADVERSGHWAAFVDGGLDREVYNALWAKTSGIEVEASDAAKAIADIIHKWQEKARLDANRAGAWIGSLPGYIVRQGHDMHKIRAAGKEKWKASMLDKLDERTFDDVAPGDEGKFLDSVYAGLASGVHLTHGGLGSPSVPSAAKAGNMAKRMSQDRVLHFRDADAAYQYNIEYGAGSLRESVLFGLERSGKNTGLMRVWGTNPQNNFEMVKRGILDRLKKEGDISGMEKVAKDAGPNGMLNNRMMEIDGSINIPGNAMFAKYSAVARAIQSMAKLGGAVLSAVSDLPIAASELKYQGVGFLSRWQTQIDGLTQGRSTKEKREIGAMLGVVMDGMVGSMIHKFSAADDLPGKMSKAMRTFFKFNGLAWWTDSLRLSNALGMSKRLAHNREIGWDALDPDLKRTLQLFGIDDGKWDLLRAGALKEADGESFLVPEGVRDLGDDQLRAYLAKFQTDKVTDGQIRKFRDELEGDLRSYFVERVNYAVITPNERTNAVMRRGLAPGTIEGEVMRFVMQFKAFPIAVIQKALGREVYGRGADITPGMKGFFDAFRGGRGEMQGLMNLMIATTVFGYVGMTMKDLAKGRTPRDPTNYKTWLAAMTQGGGGGIYGDFLFGEAKNRFGGSALDTFLGPTFGTANDVVSLFADAKEGEFKAARGFSFLINHTPFANLFYARMALDYLFLYNLREAMSPGYTRRLERRIKRENDQEFLLKPSDAMFVR